MGARGSSHQAVGRERGTPRWGAAEGKAAGRDPAGRMMILASAMRYSVGRPATGMGGGIRTYGAALPAAVWMALDIVRPYRSKSKPRRNIRGGFCRKTISVPSRDRMEAFPWQAS